MLLALEELGCQAVRHRDDARRPEQDIALRLLPEHRHRKVFIVAVTIKPLEDRVLVEPLEAEQTTASGLVIPDTAKEKPQEGRVVATGPGRFDEDGEKRIPMDVAEGDIVVFSKYGGTELKYDGKEYLLLNARDILAVVSK